MAPRLSTFPGTPSVRLYVFGTPMDDSYIYLDLPIPLISVYRTPCLGLRFIGYATMGTVGEVVRIAQVKEEEDSRIEFVPLEDSADVVLAHGDNFKFEFNVDLPDLPKVPGVLGRIAHANASSRTSTSTSRVSGDSSFRQRLDIIFNGHDPFRNRQTGGGGGEHAHIVPHYGGDSLVKKIFSLRTLEAEPPVTGVDDVRNGIILDGMLRGQFKSFSLGILKLPNYILGINDIIPSHEIPDGHQCRLVYHNLIPTSQMDIINYGFDQPVGRFLPDAPDLPSSTLLIWKYGEAIIRWYLRGNAQHQMKAASIELYKPTKLEPTSKDGSCQPREDREGVARKPDVGRNSGARNAGGSASLREDEGPLSSEDYGDESPGHILSPWTAFMLSEALPGAILARKRQEQAEREKLEAIRTWQSGVRTLDDALVAYNSDGIWGKSASSEGGEAEQKW